MKKKLVFAAALFFALAVFGAFAIGTVFATGDGSSSSWDAVTYDDGIGFTAVLQGDGSVKTQWSRYNHTESFTYYKVVRSQSNANPVYPDDGYIYYGGDIDGLTYTDNEAPHGTSYYRVCQIASPARYCSKVVTITKGAETIVPDPVPVVEPVKEEPVPTLYEESVVATVEGFEDLPVDHWSADCVKKLGEVGIVESGEGVYFRPESPVNRAEFLKLTMMTYYPEVSSYDGMVCFKDVSGSAWYASYICTAKDSGIVAGYTDNTYKPGRSISRAEGAAILVKALHLSLVEWVDVGFKDVVAEWQRQVVATAFRNALVNGYSDTKFGPNDLLTRAQAAKLICNARDNFTAPMEGEVPVIGGAETASGAEETAPVATITGSVSRSEPLIINHENTDLSKIPRLEVMSAKDTYKVAYGHTSHGSQLVTGMDVIQAANEFYDFSSDGLFNGMNDALIFNESLLSGDLGGDWETQTRALLNRSDNDINMVMWSWCGQMSGMSEVDVNAYLGATSQLEIDYPNVVFVYMTGHLDGTGTAGTLNRNNETVRNFARTYNKVLFDFADIESYDPAGSYYLDRGANDNNDYDDGNWAQNWCSANPGSPLCATNSCAHSQSLNCNMKGRAFWWMMARLAGWGG